MKDFPAEQGIDLGKPFEGMEGLKPFSMGQPEEPGREGIDTITFLASFPAIQSAIKVDGGGGGMRIQLDVPENQMGRAVRLLAWREQVLEVTVRLEAGGACNIGENRHGENQDKLGTRAKRQSEWTTAKE